MRTKYLILPLFTGVLVGSVQAATVAHWRFEEGPDGANVDRGGHGSGEYYAGALDSSGNDYHLSAWSDGGGAGYRYSSHVAGGTVNGIDNNFSVKNTGSHPAMWTSTDDALKDQTFSQFTIEATFKLENGGYRTMVGRDSKGSVIHADTQLSALYLQALPDNAIGIKFSDMDGYWHEAISEKNIFTSFDFGSDPDGNNAPWYSVAAVSNGSMLSLYLRNVDEGTPWELIASTDMTASGSTDTTLTAGEGDGSDWDAGNFSVGRGLYNGGHGDRAWGYLDEVRISDEALETGEFLYIVPEPSVALLGCVSLLGLLRRRRS